MRNIENPFMEVAEYLMRGRPLPMETNLYTEGIKPEVLAGEVVDFLGDNTGAFLIKPLLARIGYDLSKNNEIVQKVGVAGDTFDFDSILNQPTGIGCSSIIFARSIQMSGRGRPLSGTWLGKMEKHQHKPAKIKAERLENLGELMDFREKMENIDPNNRRGNPNFGVFVSRLPTIENPTFDFVVAQRFTPGQLVEHYGDSIKILANNLIESMVSTIRR